MKDQDYRQIRIAVAEDISILRKGLCNLLSADNGFKVEIEASNGLELLELLRYTDKQIDVCLLDINMPVMDGHATIKHIKEEWPDMKVLILSVFNDDYNIIRMLRSGANGYILKDCKPEELQQAIQAVHEIGFYHSELVNEYVLQLLQGKDKKSKSILSDKDYEFLSYCCSELTYKEIAEAMSLSPRTIEGYRDALCEKLEVKSRTGLVMYAIRIGVVPYGQ
jgi:two-component system invasion response regulator UvrY